MKKSLYNIFACALAAQIFSVGLRADDFVSDDELFNEEINDNGYGISDPLELVNRVTFGFNDFVYTKLLQPVADTYQTIAPDPVEEGASNFFDNLKYPVRLTGNLLQGRFKGAWVETGRFAINSTVGVAGIFTPADEVKGFEPIPKEDVGQALGSWGFPEGPYLVLPLLGPSNVRDLIGYVGDRAVDPFAEPFSFTNEHNWDWDWEWEAALAATEFTVKSPTLLERYIQLKGSAIDPYSATKNGYTQYRKAAINE